MPNKWEMRFSHREVRSAFRRLDDFFFSVSAFQNFSFQRFSSQLLNSSTVFFSFQHFSFQFSPSPLASSHFALRASRFALNLSTAQHLNFFPLTPRAGQSSARHD
jgi:hypothetical protein